MVAPPFPSPIKIKRQPGEHERNARGAFYERLRAGLICLYIGHERDDEECACEDNKDCGNPGVARYGKRPFVWREALLPSQEIPGSSASGHTCFLLGSFSFSQNK